MNFILGNWVKDCTKDVFKALAIILIGFAIILIASLIKYKPVYVVTLSGKTIGYVADKKEIESKIYNYINNKKENVAFRIENAKPDYNLELVSRTQKTNENEVLLAIKNEITTTYEVYAITLDGENKVKVSSEEEAMQIINEVKEGVNEEIDFTLGIVTEYTNNFKVESKELALTTLNDIKAEKVTAYETKKAEEAKQALLEAKKKAVATTTQLASTGEILGMQLVIPVSGVISSRFGSRDAVRSTSSHTGLDISAPTGTGVRPIANGTVVFSGPQGTYGNLVIIDHGNGIQSYYAHCSELFVSANTVVDTGTTISAVGSTGNSTGPHLHLEIRLNGTPVNPQDYLY